MKEYLEDSATSEEDVVREITATIYENSLPLFRRMIEIGKVRLALIDHAKVSHT